MSGHSMETVFAENALDQALATRLSQLPADYDPLYVKNVIVPALRSKTYIGERPALPMIDVMLSRDADVVAYRRAALSDLAPEPGGRGSNRFHPGSRKAWTRQSQEKNLRIGRYP